VTDICGYLLGEVLDIKMYRNISEVECVKRKVLNLFSLYKAHPLTVPHA
jgi:hypothetical protein